MIRKLLVLTTISWLIVATAAAEDRRVVLLSWDGTPDWVIDRLLDQGHLPNLARMIAEGVSAEHSTSVFPTKTASAHATLWTGCLPDCHGLTSNTALPPTLEHPSLLDGITAFSPSVLTAEPIFLTAARAGLDVVVVSASHAELNEDVVSKIGTSGPRSSDSLPNRTGARYRSFTGFSSRIADGKVIDHSGFTKARWRWRVRHRGRALEQTVRVADTTIFILAYDDPQDPTKGLDTVLIRQGHRSAKRAKVEARIKAHDQQSGSGYWTPPIPIESDGTIVGNTFFRLFELDPTGSSMVLYQRQVSRLTGNHDAESLAELQLVYPGFHDEPFQLYGRGQLGQQIMAGGDGRAEERALELMAFDVGLSQRVSRWVLETWDPEFLVLYSPMSDSAGHAWVGQLDPSRADTAEIADKIWPYYIRSFQLLDAWLGDLIEASGDHTAVVLTTDHGMTASHRNFYVHRVLEQAGLLSWTPAGEVDLANTKILIPAFGEFFLKVNTLDWKGGIVPQDQRRAVLEEARRALLAATDPENGVSPVKAVLFPDDYPELGLGGRTGGDLYLDLEPGYYPRSWYSEAVVSGWFPEWGEGMHGHPPWQREMHGVLFARGSGIKKGVVIPPTNNVDIAATIAALLGIAPPANSTGQAIDSMLEAVVEPDKVPNASH